MHADQATPRFGDGEFVDLSNPIDYTDIKRQSGHSPRRTWRISAADRRHRPRLQHADRRYLW
jgi:hypothetical protein